MIILKSGKNEEGKTEYYLTELDAYESFDRVIAEILRLGLSVVDQLDGIYSRTALIDLSGKKFKVIFHEDVGIYAFSLSEGANEEWLQKVLRDVVESLNA